MRRVAGLLLAALALVQCTPRPPDLEQIRSRGELRVATLNHPTTYYLNTYGPRGLEYELMRAFADSQGLRLAVLPRDNEAQLVDALRKGEADVVAAQVTYREPWSSFAWSSRTYDHVRQLVVHARGTVKPRKPADLANARLVVKAGSPQEDLLRSLASSGLQLSWQSLPANAVNGPLDAIAAGTADATIIDETSFRQIHQAYPEIVSAFVLDETRPVQWMVRRRSDQLRAAIDDFLGSPEAHQRVAAASIENPEESGPDAPRMQLEMARAFRNHIETRLPLLRPWFEEAGRETGLDWRLIAAMGYQESKWDRDAQSFNGAQGVMMLMPQTAPTVGVEDPFDPRQNILGGARYFIEVRDKLPERIREPDRTAMALAAYNVGFGHLEDARIITQSRGGNPDRWNDVRDNLPLLAQEGWFLQAKRGYARGWEPVQFVRRVQLYRDALEWQALPSIETVLQIDEESLPPNENPGIEPGSTSE